MAQERHNWLVDGSHTSNVYCGIHVRIRLEAAAMARKGGLVLTVRWFTDVLARMLFPVRIGCEIDNAKVNAQSGIQASWHSLPLCSTPGADRELLCTGRRIRSRTHQSHVVLRSEQQQLGLDTA